VKAKICIPIPARTQSEAVGLLRKAGASDADLAEVRFDYAQEELQPRLLTRATGLPLVATHRLRREGGLFAGNEEERLETLLHAAEAGFQYVDLELSTPNLRPLVERFTALGVRVMTSHHDLVSTPPLAEMRELVKRMEEAGASVCKLITTAEGVADNLTCLGLVSEVAERTPIVCFAMGDKGLVSRALSPLFGAFCTYASIEEGMETAPGQVTIAQLRRIHGLLGG